MFARWNFARYYGAIVRKTAASRGGAARPTILLKPEPMKPGPNPKRYRGRPSTRRHSHGYSSNYESNGPDVKVRGSPTQVLDRYQALSRDALASGDRVAAENYLQHAEHYQRLVNAHNAHLAQQAAQAREQPAVDANGAQPPSGGDEPERRPRRARPRPAPSAQPAAGSPAPEPANA